MRRVIVVALLALVLLGTGVMGAANSDWFRHRDFSSLYYGAHLVTRIDVYDDVDWCREARGSTFGAVDEQGTQLCPAVYLYPLWAAVVLLPLGALPLEAAGAIWVALSIAATLAGVRWCWYAVGGHPRAAPLFVALVISSEPFWLMLSGGQIGGVLTLGVGLGAWLLSRRRESSAGATLAILALKPHVLGLEALALLARALATRSPAFLAGAFGAVGGLLVLSLPFRWDWPFEWLRESFGRQTGYSPSLATAWGFAAHDLGSILFAPLVIAVVVAIALVLSRGIPRDPVTFTALAVPLSLFAGPYAWSYDFVVLALPWAFVLARADRADPAVRRAFVFSLALVASMLGWGLYLLAFTRGAETLSVWIPALTALLVAAATRIPSRT